MNYYNENDPKAAKLLRNLVSAGLIPPGDVDDRSIVHVAPSDLAGYTQCHFFAGIGGWAEALRLAGIPATTRLWTGSCPCQPFSTAGKGKGTEDERHLWPVFRDLIAECRPPVVFGEQVASVRGRAWLSTVRAEMEALAYAVGAADLCAAGIGAPHPRQRLYFVGLAESACQLHNGSGDAGQGGRDEYPDGSADGRLADTDDPRPQGRERVPQRAGERVAGEGSVGGWVADTDGYGGAKYVNQQRGRKTQGPHDTTERQSTGFPVADTGRPSPPDSFWSSADWLYCRDGRWRPVEPGTFPLAHGIPGRVAHLRGFGNAIVPQVAATFIRAVLMP